MDSIQSLPLGKIVAIIAIFGVIFAAGKWVGYVNADRESFKDFIKEVRADIKQILKKLPSVTLAGSSPLRLTDIGKEISRKLKASTWAKEASVSLMSKVRGKHPYEIQEFCIDYMINDFVPTESMDIEIQTCAYDNGIGKDEVLKVLAVELRDELLRRLEMEGE